MVTTRKLDKKGQAETKHQTSNNGKKYKRKVVQFEPTTLHQSSIINP